jgi:hypothetical protein
LSLECNDMLLLERDIGCAAVSALATPTNVLKGRSEPTGEQALAMEEINHSQGLKDGQAFSYS